MRRREVGKGCGNESENLPLESGGENIYEM
jgi:hypothetical protein